MVARRDVWDPSAGPSADPSADPSVWDSVFTFRQTAVVCFAASLLSCLMTYYWALRRLAHHLSRTAHSYAAM